MLQNILLNNTIIVALYFIYIDLVKGFVSLMSKRYVAKAPIK